MFSQLCCLWRLFNSKLELWNQQKLEKFAEMKQELHDNEQHIKVLYKAHEMANFRYFCC